MAGETPITIIGNLTGDPELRFTPSGAAVANFTIASTPRTFDKQSNEWKDGETLFMRCSIWKDAAENVAESLTKGVRVVAVGRLKQRSYDTKEGEKRTVIELEVDEVGPSLRYANAKVQRTTRTGPQQGSPQQQQEFGGQAAQRFDQSQGQWGQQPQQQGDSWATGPSGGPQQGPPQQGGGWGGQRAPSYDEPPF
jgi:single-strand DNA-binding protein